jgi:hypothetical protein
LGSATAMHSDEIADLIGAFLEQHSLDGVRS